MREGLEITTAAGGTRLWPYRELRQTQGAYAGEEVRLERGGELPETLLVPDAAFLQSLHEAAPDVGPRFHDPRRRSARLRWTIVAAGGVLAATVAIYLWGIPLLAALVTPHVPVAWEETLGRSAVSYLAPPERRCGDPALGVAMDAIVARLLAAGPPSPYTMRVYVVNRPVVNALAAPGGHVVIFHGLLERTGTPEELAGVIAHELQHILRRHTTRAVIQDVGTGLLLMALTGDMTGPLAYGLETARALGELRYSRRAEEEADRRGHEDAPRRPRGSRRHDRLLREDAEGGGRAAQGPHVPLLAPDARRAHRPPQVPGRHRQRPVRARPASRGLARPDEALLARDRQAGVRSYIPTFSLCGRPLRLRMSECKT